MFFFTDNVRVVSPCSGRNQRTWCRRRDKDDRTTSSKRGQSGRAYQELDEQVERNTKNHRGKTILFLCGVVLVLLEKEDLANGRGDHDFPVLRTCLAQHPRWISQNRKMPSFVSRYLIAKNLTRLMPQWSDSAGIIVCETWIALKFCSNVSRVLFPALDCGHSYLFQALIGSCCYHALLCNWLL